MTNDWGRKKRELTITIQGDLTAKQYEEVRRRMLKICDKYDLGFATADVWSGEMVDQI